MPPPPGLTLVLPALLGVVTVGLGALTLDVVGNPSGPPVGETGGFLNVVAAAAGDADTIDQMAAAALAGAMTGLDEDEAPVRVSHLAAQPGLHESSVQMFASFG